MLVLSRKKGEGITLDQNITINILSIEGDRVRIGITAPVDMRIYRNELLEETIHTNREAVNAPLLNLSALD